MLFCSYVGVFQRLEWQVPPPDDEVHCVFIDGVLWYGVLFCSYVAVFQRLEWQVPPPDDEVHCVFIDGVLWYGVLFCSYVAVFQRLEWQVPPPDDEVHCVFIEVCCSVVCYSVAMLLCFRDWNGKFRHPMTKCTVYL